MIVTLRRLKFLARAGYASRGVVYLIIGTFACLAAFGPVGRKGAKGALLTLLAQPFGKGLVALMIAGLTGYTGWRLVQSLLDTDDHGWSAKGTAVRGGLFASAVTHGVLALYALSLLGLFWSGGEGGMSFADLLARTMTSKALLLVLSLTFAGVAAAHWIKAATRRYADHFDASERVMWFLHPVSIVGLVARGAVWGVLALLLFLRFRRNVPPESEPPGVREALGYIQGLPMGDWLLATTGVGLILFGGYSLSQAVWRRINVEDAG